MLLGIYLFQILNIGYFTLFGDAYFKGGLIYLVLQSLALIFMNHHYTTKKRTSRMHLAHLEECSTTQGPPKIKDVNLLVLG